MELEEQEPELYLDSECELDQEWGFNRTASDMFQWCEELY